MITKDFSNGTISDLGKIDIYLIDQIQKGRVNSNSKILDAGYGKGRNLEFFVKQDADIFGIDHNADYLPIVLGQVEKWNPGFSGKRFITGRVEEMPYENDHFDFIFSIAVLHFAKSHQHFQAMLIEMLRTLKTDGYLMFRMTAWHTFTLSEKTDSGLVEISDGPRYMLDIEWLKQFAAENTLKLSDPIKTTNVDGLRTMTTVVLQK
jgi:ubiquinone/menaquinone biosynthesis C-methylase UbiE